MTSGLSPLPPQRYQAAPVIPQDRAVYRIKEGKFFGPDDHLYHEGDMIALEDEPNLEMEPLNAIAAKRMKDFLTKLDVAGKKAAQAAGKAYNSLADAFENSRALYTQESKRVQLIQGKELVPLMGAKKNRGVNSRVSKIEAEDGPSLMGTAQGKLSLSALTSQGVDNNGAE